MKKKNLKQNQDAAKKGSNQVAKFIERLSMGINLWEILNFILDKM